MAKAVSVLDELPPIRGRYTENAALGEKGWFRAGGTADVLFKPADHEDLAQFLASCPESTPLTFFGVMSNIIVRDGGVRGVVIRLGRDFAGIDVIDENSDFKNMDFENADASFASQTTPFISNYVKSIIEGRDNIEEKSGPETKTKARFIRTGSMALDGTVATAAAKARIAGLEFYSGIPGTIGGALRMNAGCYGTETKDVLVEAQAYDRQGQLHCLTPEQMGMGYRHTTTPEDYIFISAVFQGHEGDPEEIKAHMAKIKEQRGETQPIRERTGGSTFANPSATELSQAGLSEDTKVWQLIEQAGCRGLQIGGAQMSELHCNFMINTGEATGADLENMGEEVRKRVYEQSGIRLRWEIKRIGEF